MTEEYPLDPPLSAEQVARVAQLTEEQIHDIDQALWDNIGPQWRKTAAVILGAMSDLKDNDKRVMGIPDLYYGERLKKMVREGYLDGQGDIDRMLGFHVRLPKEI